MKGRTKEIKDRMTSFLTLLETAVVNIFLPSLHQGKMTSMDMVRGLITREEKELERPALPANDHGEVSIQVPPILPATDQTTTDPPTVAANATPTVAATTTPTRTKPSKAKEKTTTAEDRNKRNTRLTERHSHPTTKRKRDPDRFKTEFSKNVRDMKELYLAKRQKNQGDNKRCIEFMEEWFPVLQGRQKNQSLRYRN